MVELIAAAFGWFALGWACRGWALKRRLRKPPYSSAAIAWKAEEAQRAIDMSARVKHAAELYAKFIDPSMGVPWEEGHTQRGNGHGGASTPKPPIKPQPSGGHLIREGQLWGGYQPRPQSGAPNPPPEAP